MKLTWYGHSCFKLESGDGSIVFDPYSPGSVPGLSLCSISADAVICSHEHRDHNCRDAVTLSGRPFTGEITSVQCFHDEKGGQLRGKNTISVVETEGMRLAHLGDLGHEPDEAQLAAIGRVDVIMLPVGGFYTVDAPAARRVADRIGARTVIPMHYRGDGFGYDVLSAADEFLSLSKNVRRFDTNVLTDADLDGEFTAFLRVKNILL